MSEPTNISTPPTPTESDSVVYAERRGDGAVAESAAPPGAWVSTAALAAALAADATISPRVAVSLDLPKTISEPVKPKIKRAPKHDFKDGRGRVFAHRHDNGGGWVEDTASVGADVYVGRSAQVMNHATLFGKGIRIESKATVKGHALVLQDTHLAGFAQVAGKATVRATTMTGNCQITGTAEVANCGMEGAVAVGGSACVKGSRFSGRVSVQDNAVVVAAHARGFIQITGNALVARSTLEGVIEVIEHGQVLRSCVLNFQYHVNYLPWHEYAKRVLRPEFFTRICGHATLQNDTNFNGPVVLAGRSVLDNCRFFVEYPEARVSALYVTPAADGSVDMGQPLFTRDKIENKRWCNTTVSNHGELMRLLALEEQNPSNSLRTVRTPELLSPFSLERMATGRRIVPV